nr:EstDL30 [uncultured bacterium]
MNVVESVPVLVEAPCGKLEGSRRGGLSSFKGIPFATARRWHMPERAQPWSGVRSARAPGAVAPQNPTPLEGLIASGGKNEQSEGCLFLNVWTPACDAAKRPVMVWIHGGAFSTGAGSIGLYSGKNLATVGDVVVVTINYRLSSLGFLRLTDITDGRIPSTGAEGIADQIAALSWVRDNIVAFGGDPGNVTIFGESAGAMSVACLLASPKARGLFHKAISQSGTAHIARPREHANRVAEVFLGHLGAAANDLERAPVEALLKAQADLTAEVDNKQDPHKLGTMALQPVVDGDVLPLWPIEAVRAGSAAGVPIIAGTTTEEWKLWTALDSKFHTMDEDKLARWAERMFGDEAAALLAADREGSPYERYVQMQTDRAFREPTRRMLAAQSVHAPVYEYAFDWRSPAMGGAFGACHAMELGFVFGTHSLPGADNFFGKGPEAEAISLAMIQAWTSFARTGVPKADGVDAWPQWSKASPAAMVFGADSRAAHVSCFEPRQAWAALPDRFVGP